MAIALDVPHIHCTELARDGDTGGLLDDNATAGVLVSDLPGACESVGHVPEQTVSPPHRRVICQHRQATMEGTVDTTCNALWKDGAGAHHRCRGSDVLQVSYASIDWAPSSVG